MMTKEKNKIRRKGYHTLSSVMLTLLLISQSLTGLNVYASAATTSTNVLAESSLSIADIGTTNLASYQVGDFDNDGDIDILTQDGGVGKEVTFWENTGNGSFTKDEADHFPKPLASLSLSYLPTRVADFDNDGDLDIYCRVSGASNDLYYQNDGSGNFTSATLPIPDSSTSNVSCYQLGDIDNDGDIDILTQDGGVGKTVTFWVNNGSGSFQESTGEPVMEAKSGLNLNINMTKVEDFDNDGDLDIYCRVSGPSNDLYYQNDGSGKFATAALPIPDGNTTNIVCYQVGDFDNNGAIDILTQDGGAGKTVTFWANNGSGLFQERAVGPISGTIAGLNMASTFTKTADFDNDGDLDLYSRVIDTTSRLFYRNSNMPPRVISVTPASNATNVGISDNITLNLTTSSSITKGAGTISIRVDDGDGDYSDDTIYESFSSSDPRVTITENAGLSTVIIDPAGEFEPNTTYYLVISPAAFLDAEGKGFVALVGNRFHPGIPDPAIKLAGNSLHGLADRTLISFSTASVDSSDATLKISSRVKGQTTELGTPSAVLGSETEGAVTLTAAQAADTSNADAYATLFEPSDNKVTSVKVVKYGAGSTVTEVTFDSATPYGNEAISNGDFFIIRVVAQDKTTTLYYRVVINVTASPEAPGITGPTAMNLTEGYDATSTGVYTLTGTAPVTVIKISGNEKITWNDTDKKLNIAAGLAAGSYTVNLKASNATEPEATLTFTLTVDAIGTIVAELDHPGNSGTVTTTPYEDLQTALNDTVDGDTVRVMAGTLTGQYLVTKNITLQGAGTDETILQSPNTGGLINSEQDMLTNNGRHRVPVLELRVNTSSGGTVTVKNLTIDGNHQGFESDAANSSIGLDREFIGIAVFDTNAVIDGVVIKNIAPETDTTGWRFKNYGILAEGSNALSSAVTVTVKDSLIHDFQEIGILAWGPKLHAIITNNTITGTLINSVASGEAGYWGTLAQRGVQIGGNNAINPGNNYATVAGTTAVISGNTIQNIGTAGPYTPSHINLWSAGEVEIFDNTLSGCSEPVTYKAAGMNLEAQRASANIHDNSLSKLYRGIKVSGKTAAAGIHGVTYDYGAHTLTNNSMTMVEYAVYDTSTGNDDENAETITLSSAKIVGNSKNYQEYLLYGGDDSFIDTGLAPTKVDGGTGADVITTGAGNDTLIGGEDDDILTGGDGDDIFQYFSSINNGTDTIADFGDEDIIRVIGADFSFGNVTAGDGTNVAAGSVQLAASGGKTFLYIDTDATKDEAELQIILTGTFKPSDFLLNGTDISLVVAPGITGPISMDLTEGYNATSTGVYTITGKAPVTITKTSGNTSITWNDTTKKLDIAAGLAAGNYTVTLKASNGTTTEAMLTFDLTVNAAPVAPGITGSTTMSLTEGYAATSTGAYTITGTAPVAITKTSGNASIIWNSTTKKLDIAAGLAEGSYTVELKASNGTEPDATLTFNLTVNAAPVAPGITGPATMSLTEGYAATSTGAYTITGTAPITITKISGNASIIWNSTTKKLDIAAGLAEGSYTVELKASNGTEPDATLTFNLTVNAAPVAPGITGPATMSLTEGYTATSTGAYTITGTTPVTVTKVSGDTKITWNDTDKKLNVAEGLAAGSYPVELKASNGTEPDATLTFILTVNAAPVAPGITGATTMSLTEGYAATSTGAYTITGTTPVTVTKVSGDTKITWNDTDKKLDIAAGLAAGSYPVELKASNGTEPDATLTFTLTVGTASVAPGITGSTTMSLTEGYSATSTGIYTITGTAPVMVTKTSGDASITWNDITKKLDIAEGLAAGSYTVELKASNGTEPDATLTFILTVGTASVAPGITGATAMSLTEGYAATSTGVYTITGTAPVTVTKKSGDASITWNDTTKKLDIAAGLAAGSYPVELKASNGTEADATLIFTLTIGTASATLGITGPTAMSLTEGYAATSTEAYTVTGSALVIVTKTSGDASITWNDTTKKLDIAAGLAAGSYTVELSASNGIDTDVTLTFLLTVDAASLSPLAPTAITAIPGNTKITLNWSSVAGATGYKIYQSETAGTYGSPLALVEGSVNSYDVTGITNGTTYYFVIKAIKDGVDSPNSAEVNAVSKTVPGAPTNVSATAGNGQATVSFTAPEDNGGSAITGYIVTASPGNITVTGNGTTITVTGLRNGTTYTFTVKALNIAGDGANSTASNTVTPQTPSTGGSTGGNTGGSAGGSTTPANPASPGVTEITVDVKQGNSDSTISQIKIERRTGDNGEKTDTVTYQEGKAQETVKKLKEENKNTARIVIPDEKDEIAETKVTIPAKSLAVLAKGGINLQIDTEEAKIDILKSTITDISQGAADDLYFRLVPVKDNTQKETTINRALFEVAIVSGNSNTNLSIVGNPVTIETNMSSTEADITLPLTGIAIPSNPTKRAALLQQLAVYIEHSDGDKELVQGELVEYKKGVYGIRFHITKFSTFTVVKTDAFLKSSNASILKVMIPSGAIIKGTGITASVSNKTSSVTVKIKVNDKAVWQLYSDKNCTKAVAKNKINLKTGANISYIKVTAEDRTSKVYKLTINRESLSAANIIKVIAPAEAAVKGKMITAMVANETASVTVKLTVSDKATWRLYSNQACTKEITSHKLSLKEGVNTAYIKVTAENGKTSKVYTLKVTRKEVKYKEYIKLGLIGSKTYAEKVAKIFTEEYDCKNVVVKPEGNYFRVTMNFIDKSEAVKACEDMIIRQYIIHYYFMEQNK